MHYSFRNVRFRETFLVAENERPSLFSHTHMQTSESVFKWAGVLIRSLHSRSQLEPLQPQASPDLCAFPRAPILSSFLASGSSFSAPLNPTLVSSIFPFSQLSQALNRPEVKCSFLSLISSKKQPTYSRHMSINY